jgi:hypothetical protein
VSVRFEKWRNFVEMGEERLSDKSEIRAPPTQPGTANSAAASDTVGFL